MVFDNAFDDALGSVPVSADVEVTVEVETNTSGSSSPGGGGGGADSTSGSEGRRTHDYVADFNFVIEIDGLQAGAFQKCDGLSWEADLIETRDSMDPYPRYRPGIRRFGKLKLTKGYVSDSTLWTWCESIMKGKHDRRNGAITLYDDDGQSAVVSYTFIDALPVKWSGFRLDGKGAGGLVEEIELAVESIELSE